MDDKKMVAFALLVLFGGNFSGILNTVNPDIRSDPFTGDDGERLRAEIRRECEKNLSFLQAQIDDIESADDDLEEKYHDHSHEAQQRWVIERLNHIEQELHRLGGDRTQ